MPAHISHCESSNTLIIVADSDLLHNRFIARIQNLFGFSIVNLLNDNLHFLLNAVENLTGSEDLISIRSRGKFSRPFTRVKAIEKKAEIRWKEREKELQKRVEEINRRLRELQQPQEGDRKRHLLSQAISKEIERFREERTQMRKELREVRKNLRQDKEKLGNNLFIINTFLIPTLILLLVLGILLFKARRWRS